MANISSYNQLSSWNEDDDLLFVQQPDAPKKAHPSQMKEYILEGLDVASVGGVGKYISVISETAGKISATAEAMDAAPTEGSSKAVTSGGIKTAIDDSVSLKTATGNPITLTDAANANAEELSMTIEPIQSGSGDPSPTNVRPISGISEAVVTRTGNNLIDESALIAAELDPTTGQPSASTNVKITPMISIKSSDTYLFAHQNNEPFRIFAYAADGTFIERTDIYYDDAVVTTGASWTYVRIQGAKSAWIYADLVLMQTVDITIQLGQTVYGGSVNFKTGEVTVTHVFLSGTITSLTNLPYVPKYQQGGEGRNKNLCDKLTYAYHLNNDPHFFFENNRLVTRGVDVSTEIELCYELATPTTLTLTPAELELLKGNNTITANGAEISLSYYPDNAIGALAGRVDDKADITYVDNKVKKLATRTIQYTSTSTNLEYTGVNVSCPTGHTYIVRAKCDWDNGYTASIAASDSSTDVSTWRRFAYGDSAYITFMLNEGETAYIWGKWSVAGKNRVHLSITDITI